MERNKLEYSMQAVRRQMETDLDLLGSSHEQ